MTVTVVTPWRDAHELAVRYADAIQAGQPDMLIVVDNGSDPPLHGQACLRQTVTGCHTTIIRSDINRGFSPACNRGLHDATTDAVLFLNNDIVHTGGRWLAAIRETLRPGVLVGAKLHPAAAHAAVDGRPQPYLDGWCLAGMRADLLNLGGWDERMEEPSYFADNLLCLNARAAGMRLVEVPVALRHLGNYTSRRMDVAAVSQRNYLRYADTVRRWRVAA